MSWLQTGDGQKSQWPWACLPTSSFDSIFPDISSQYAFITLFPSPKPPVVNIERSQSTLPLPPVTCSRSPGSVSSSQRVSWAPAIISAGCHPLHMGLETLLRQPWERPCPLPWLSYGVLLPASCPWAPLCLLRCGFYHITWRRSSSILESDHFCGSVLWLRHEGTLLIIPRNWGQILTSLVFGKSPKSAFTKQLEYNRKKITSSDWILKRAMLLWTQWGIKYTTRDLRQKCPRPCSHTRSPTN